MAKNPGLNSILGFIQDGRKIVEELNRFSPQVKEQLGALFSELKSNNNSEEQIKDAIQFAVNRMKQKPHIILGTDPNDPPEMIKEIYHTKAKYFHPDGKHPDPDRFAKIHDAYKKLINE